MSPPLMTRATIMSPRVAYRRSKVKNIVRVFETIVRLWMDSHSVLPEGLSFPLIWKS